MCVCGGLCVCVCVCVHVCVCLMESEAVTWILRVPCALPSILIVRKTEKEDICNFIATLMAFSTIEELRFLMHSVHKYKGQWTASPLLVIIHAFKQIRRDA